VEVVKQVVFSFGTPLFTCLPELSTELHYIVF